MSRSSYKTSFVLFIYYLYPELPYMYVICKHPKLCLIEPKTTFHCFTPFTSHIDYGFLISLRLTHPSNSSIDSIFILCGPVNPLSGPVHLFVHHFHIVRHNSLDLSKLLPFHVTNSSRPWDLDMSALSSSYD